MSKQVLRCSVLGCVFTGSTVNSLNHHVTAFHQSSDYIWCFFCNFSSKDQHEVMYTHECPYEEERMAELDRLDQLVGAHRAMEPTTSSRADVDLQSSSERTQQHINHLLTELGRRKRPRMINPSNRSITRSDYRGEEEDFELEDSAEDSAEDSHSSDDDFVPHLYKPKLTPVSKRKKKIAAKKKSTAKIAAKTTAKAPSKRGRPRKITKTAIQLTDDGEDVAEESSLTNQTETSINDPFSTSKCLETDDDADPHALQIDESFVSDKSENPIDDQCEANKLPGTDGEANEGALQIDESSVADKPEKPISDPSETERAHEVDENNDENNNENNDENNDKTDKNIHQMVDENNEKESPSAKEVAEDEDQVGRLRQVVFNKIDEKLAKLHA